VRLYECYSEKELRSKANRLGPLGLGLIKSMLSSVLFPLLHCSAECIEMLSMFMFVVLRSEGIGPIGRDQRLTDCAH